ncbi:MHYT domain-containing protein [Pseudomonas japonica]|uniref:MHYT domain-containing protein n=1 Tax=Pseudomonas japonica TaxID=256466 RepID=UPI0015E37F57|nr:MHYT domain-containing protein [Pseudomonas japonica]MBA1290567.1 response regulator [Pseudomonas japonica]
MPITYSLPLVWLSILIAIAGSFTALDLIGRTTATQGWVRRAWLCSGAFCMGGSIWSMHFVGMLAFGMPGMQIHYDIPLTVASLVVPIAVTAISFFAIRERKLSWFTLSTGGLFMGLGIGAMHYIGMAAMTMNAGLSYNPLWVTTSFAIAIGASTVALWLSCQTRRLLFRAISALVMGFAVAGMHYTAMVAASFTPMDGAAQVPDAGIDLLTLAVSVAGSTFIVLLLGLAASIHDRRMAMMSEREAQALRLSEARLRDLYSKTPLPLHALDSEGRLESVSDAWLRLVGFRREDVIGRPLINFMTESSARQMLTHDWPILLESGEYLNAEYRLVIRNGEFIDVLASARLEQTSQGILIIGGLVNITERKNAEAALRQAQKMEAVGKLTGGVAHDFNNLLNVISGSLELLRARIPDEIPKAAKLIDNALIATQRGTALTQRMLAFARKQELKPVSAGLAEIVLGLRELLQRSTGPNIAIECRFPLSLPPAYVDVNQLEMVLMNLVLNARDAMPAGGTICIEGELRSARSPLPERGCEYVVLSVQDNGSGMSPETMSRATEPFFTTKAPGKGTGLGLSMAQGLVEQSGGRFNIKSTLGEGTRIELWLPAGVPATTGTSLATVPDTPTPAYNPALSILLVDDDPLVLANTSDLLEDMGAKVTTASSGEVALGTLRSADSFDLLVTDQMMPGMSGTQLIQIASLERPNLPALLITGYAELSATERPAHLLAKPFTQQALRSAIGRVTGAPKSNVVPLREG